MILAYKDVEKTKGMAEKTRQEYVDEYGKTIYSSTRPYDTQVIEFKSTKAPNWSLLDQTWEALEMNVNQVDKIKIHWNKENNP